jgi:adenylate kinase
VAVEADRLGRPRQSGPGLALLGPPGCGKGTQAELLAEKLSVPDISTGEMLRAAVQSGSALGKRVESLLDAGELVDDATMEAVVEERLGRADARKGFILDGYPRTLPQAGALSGILERRGLALDAAVLLRVSEEELIRRMLSRNRSDDKEEVVRRRIEIYQEKTRPLIDYYRQRDLLVEVDGQQPIAEVQAEIVSSLRTTVG